MCASKINIEKFCRHSINPSVCKHHNVSGKKNYSIKADLYLQTRKLKFVD